MKYPQLSLDEVKGPKAVIETTMGTITAQLCAPGMGIS